MKNVLVIHFSQTGQLTDILENFISSFDDCLITWVRVEPEESYPFPWDTGSFFDKMPESVMEIPVPLKPFDIPRLDFDLVIFGYQPWYLSPSIPAISILKDPQFKEVVKGKPIVAVCGARNMWLNAFDAVRRMLEEAGGELIIHVPFVDRNGNLVSVLTILHWLFKGRKDRLLGVFPIPGVHPDDIGKAGGLGTVFWKRFKSGALEGLQLELNRVGIVRIPANILFMERKAKRMFLLWADFILKANSAKQRSRRIVWFKYYLLSALFIVSPFVLLIYNLLRPLTLRSERKLRSHYLNISKHN